MWTACQVLLATLSLLQCVACGDSKHYGIEDVYYGMTRADLESEYSSQMVPLYGHQPSDPPTRRPSGDMAAPSGFSTVSGAATIADFYRIPTKDGHLFAVAVQKAAFPADRTRVPEIVVAILSAREMHHSVSDEVADVVRIYGTPAARREESGAVSMGWGKVENRFPIGHGNGTGVAFVASPNGLSLLTVGDSRTFSALAGLTDYIFRK